MSRMTTSAPSARRLRDGVLADDRRRDARLGEDRDVEVAAEHAQLLDGGGALEVGGDEQADLPCFFR